MRSCYRTKFSEAMEGREVGRHERLAREEPSAGDMKSVWFFKVLLFRGTTAFGV